jgi:hypothetical protein
LRLRFDSVERTARGARLSDGTDRLRCYRDGGAGTIGHPGPRDPRQVGIDKSELRTELVDCRRFVGAFGWLVHAVWMPREAVCLPSSGGDIRRLDPLMVSASTTVHCCVVGAYV